MTPRSKDLVIVIDQSSQMGSNYRDNRLLAYAQKAASTVIDTLNIRDRVGALATDTLNIRDRVGVLAGDTLNIGDRVGVLAAGTE